MLKCDYAPWLWKNPGVGSKCDYNGYILQTFKVDNKPISFKGAIYLLRWLGKVVTQKTKIRTRMLATSNSSASCFGFHRDDSQILPDNGDSVPPTSRPFLLPRSVPRPAPQTSTNNIQDSSQAM
ncbi:uncharacterized protein LOC107479206 [Arachis duranensis]|uniref:Uncharacterized protein LOC107479206 n=1 Tax=Arachis duranensis TaxID=130453 RepID=A0A9C6WGK5_ARADU|nr:uncharacterized protein LOC107479206 [Arachis duranensis]